MTTTHSPGGTAAAAAALAGVVVKHDVRLGDRRAAFLGCGDSLAAARPAENLGHRVLSAGDVAWSGEAPRGVDVVVPLSWSGRTGATVQAARIARDAGLEVISVTTNSGSPLAEVSDETIIIPDPHLQETIPALGYAVHSAALALLCTGDPLPLRQVAADWSAAASLAAELTAQVGAVPHAVSIAPMPDVPGAAEFWMLKIIEATGLAVRVVPIEETGHVDYFIGPQRHLVVVLSGAQDAPRATALGAALTANGMTVAQVRIESLTTATGWTRQVVGGVAGADAAAALAAHWRRPPFRGGEVDMSAQHIQLTTGA